MMKASEPDRELICAGRGSQIWWSAPGGSSTFTVKSSPPICSTNHANGGIVTVTTLPCAPRGERGPQETAAIAIKTSHNEIFFMPLFVQCKINNLRNPRVKRFSDETVQRHIVIVL